MRYWADKKLLLALISTAFVCGVVFYSHSDTYKKIEQYIGLPVLFKIKDAALGKRKLPKKIKIFSFDDHSYVDLGNPDLMSAELYKHVVRGLCERKPRVIMIDKQFADLGKSKKDRKIFKKIFEDCPIIATGVVATPTGIYGQKEITRQEFLRGSQVKSPPETNSETKKFFYGPDKAIADSVHKLGLITYKAPGNYIALESAKDTVVPHLGLHAAKTMEWKNGSLFIDEKRTKLNLDQQNIVNWIDPDDMSKKAVQLHKVYRVAKNGAPIHIVNEDDVVIILPNMFTGSADFGHTVYGTQPLGLSIISVVADTLEHSWLTRFKPAFLPCLFLILISFMNVFFTPKTNWSFLIHLACHPIFFSVCLFLFIKAGVAVDWLHPLAFMNLSFMLLTLPKFVTIQKQSNRLETALDGLLSKKTVDFLRKNPERLKFEPSERVISAMFVDFVNFSLVSEKVSPLQLFDRLSLHLGSLSEIVHRNGGIVDKTLGDGLLCYFGYNPFMQSFSNAHADQAMQCAIEMHQWVLDQWQEQRDILKVFPLRIGINTGSAFVGNVCDKNRIEYSIVGKTVNFAQRYESACAPFHILIGEKTYHYLSDEEITRNCIDKKISVKHIQKKITAKELDPFKLNPGSEASTRLDDFREQALSNLTKGVKDAA